MGIVGFWGFFLRLGSIVVSVPVSVWVVVLDSSFSIGSMKSSPFVFAAGYTKPDWKIERFESGFGITNIGDFLPLS